MTITVHDVRFAVHNIHTRMPFRYGIAVMTTVPHLFLEATCTVDGKEARGLAADNLIPKWFTKDPESSFRQEVAEMLAVIEAAAGFARDQGSASTLFDWWQALYARQQQWAVGEGYPPLLWNFGVSLVERAVLDAACRAWRIPFAEAVRANLPGIRLEAIHPELGAAAPADLLPAAPLSTIRVRHTVGLSDPLTDDEIPAGELIADGLPHSLAANIGRYGLDHFKLKVSGNAEADLQRLRRIATVIRTRLDRPFFFTLDGNEQYREVAAFRAFWEALAADPQLDDFLDHLLFVEQPLYRGVALSPETGEALRAWADRPPMIIDESDATVASLRRALACGYQGTSHKNCKGVFKGIANACLLAYRRRQGNAGLLSGEDLANVGPVALLQDLAVMASLGIAHVERNGHHYFTGLSIFPAPVEAAILAHHADLYRRHERGYAALDVVEGQVAIMSLVRAPFGVGAPLDLAWFTPLSTWNFDSLTSESDSLEENNSYGKSD